MESSLILKEFLETAVALNKTDNKKRYVFYSNGTWQLTSRLPYEIDFPLFYVAENGMAHAVDF